MEDRPPDPGQARTDRPKTERSDPPRLASAIRAARADYAERADSLDRLRTVAEARLAVLRDALEPVLAQIPREVDLFDIGLIPGETPRLFIDMIAFVDMARDRRGFRLVQDRRDGRVLLAEAETLDAIVDAVTAYIARRLIERDRMLASLDGPWMERGPRASVQAPDPRGSTLASGGLMRAWSEGWRELRRGGALHVAGQLFWFVVEVLGLLSLFALLFFGARALLVALSVAVALL